MTSKELLQKLLPEPWVTETDGETFVGPYGAKIVTSAMLYIEADRPYKPIQFRVGIDSLVNFVKTRTPYRVHLLWCLQQFDPNWRVCEDGKLVYGSDDRGFQVSIVTEGGDESVLEFSPAPLLSLKTKGPTETVDTIRKQHKERFLEVAIREFVRLADNEFPSLDFELTDDGCVSIQDGMWIVSIGKLNWCLSENVPWELPDDREKLDGPGKTIDLLRYRSFRYRCIRNLINEGKTLDQVVVFDTENDPDNVKLNVKIWDFVQADLRRRKRACEDDGEADPDPAKREKSEPPVGQGEVRGPGSAPASSLLPERERSTGDPVCAP